MKKGLALAVIRQRNAIWGVPVRKRCTTAEKVPAMRNRCARFKFQRFYRADEGMTVGVMNQMVMVNRIFGLYLFRLAGLFDFSIMLVMVRMGTACCNTDPCASSKHKANPPQREAHCNGSKVRRRIRISLRIAADFSRTYWRRGWMCSKE